MTITAALVFVGSELVKTDIAEENRGTVTAALRTVGVDVISVHIVHDEITLLSDLLSFLSVRVAYILTFGGLGPTLDDITLQAVARAFSLPVVTKHVTDVAAYERMSGSETVQSELRNYPASAEVISTHHGPVVRTRNIFSLPGLPRLVRARLPEVLPRLNGTPLHASSLTFPIPQSRIAASLERAQVAHPSVSIGCHAEKKPLEGTTITFEGPDAAEVARCSSFLNRQISLEDSDS